MELLLSSKIKHVVVLMEENRAFDHMFGFSSTPSWKIDGLIGNESNPLDTRKPNGPSVRVSNNASQVVTCDPDHATSATTAKVFGKAAVAAGNLTNPTMSGFAEFELDYRRYTKAHAFCGVLESYKPSQIPIITTLAREYAVMDRFFCSLPGPTWPNRLFAAAATSAGLTATDSCPWYREEKGTFFDQRTIYDQVGTPTLPTH